MLKRTLRGAVPLIVPPTASGVDLNTAFGGWLAPGDGEGDGPGCTVSAAEQRALWVAVVTVNAAVNVPAAA